MHVRVKRSVWLTVHSEVICGNDELKAVLDRDLHIRNVLAVTVFVPVMEVLNDLFKDNATSEEMVSNWDLASRDRSNEQADLGSCKAIRSSVVDNQAGHATLLEKEKAGLS